MPTPERLRAICGLTADQLRTELESGKTLAQIATAQGKTADGLVQAILNAQKSNLDKLVTAGKLTADQEQAIEARLQTMITNLVNDTGPAAGPVAGGELTSTSASAAASARGSASARSAPT